MSSLFVCGKCGEIYLNLAEIGYCLGPKDDMGEAIEEYWEMTGFERSDI